MWLFLMDSKMNKLFAALCYTSCKIPKCLHENIPLFLYLLYLLPAFFLHLLVVHHVDEEPLQSGARGFRSRVK